MRSVKYILAPQYFLYFGILGIYLPYFNLYCYHLDFTGFQIGVLSSLRTFATALFPLVWGALADRFLIRRPIYLFCALISAGVWAFYLLTTDFYAMFAITAFYGIFHAPLISFLESFSMDLLGNEKNSYGRLRAWGSISFILTVIVVGRAIDAFSTHIILILILAGKLMFFMIAARTPAPASVRQKTFSTGARALLSKQVFTFLAAAFLMLLSHGTYYGFFSIHLENLGYHGTFIGITWALASMAEIFVMINSERIFRRFSYEYVLILSFAAAGLRWLILFFATSAALILLTQLLHAFTYGAFHVASILYIDKLTPSEAKTLGQAVNNAVTFGLGIMTGFFINGYLFDIIGAQSLFAISAGLALLGGGLMLYNLKHMTASAQI
ncbi:MAG TPA: MFS transporter [Desulfosalsimonadaceae bacterium]|nr:MFS transporter [Desulfosalsimonadaceae bacterium]